MLLRVEGRMLWAEGCRQGGADSAASRRRVLTLLFVQADSEHLVPHARSRRPQRAQAHTRAQPRSLESMQTYAAINVKITSANMRVSLFTAFSSPGREERGGQVQTFYVKSLKGTRGREREMDGADGDRENGTTAQTNIQELLSCHELY